MHPVREGRQLHWRGLGSPVWPNVADVGAGPIGTDGTRIAHELVRRCRENRTWSDATRGCPFRHHRRQREPSPLLQSAIRPNPGWIDRPPRASRENRFGNLRQGILNSQISTKDERSRVPPTAAIRHSGSTRPRRHVFPYSPPSTARRTDACRRESGTGARQDRETVRARERPESRFTCLPRSRLRDFLEFFRSPRSHRLSGVLRNALALSQKRLWGTDGSCAKPAH